MLERVVNQESISIVSRGGTKSITSPTNSVVHMRQQRDISVLVRITMMFSRWLMTSSTLITTRNLILNMHGVCWGMSINGLALTLLNLVGVQSEKLERHVHKLQAPLLVIMRSVLKVSRLLKLKGIMLKGSLLLSIRAFGKWRRRISWWRRNCQSLPY